MEILYYSLIIIMMMYVEGESHVYFPARTKHKAIMLVIENLGKYFMKNQLMVLI